MSEFHLEGKEEKTKLFEERGSDEFLLDNCREGKTTGTERVKVVKETETKDGRKEGSLSEVLIRRAGFWRL